MSVPARVELALIELDVKLRRLVKRRLAERIVRRSAGRVRRMRRRLAAEKWNILLLLFLFIYYFFLFDLFIYFCYVFYGCMWLV